MSQKRALVFGASGQSGRYLCDLLIRKGYNVTGTRYNHPLSSCIADGVDNRLNAPYWATCDIRHRLQVHSLIRECEPDEIYNLASLMYTPDSWMNPREYTEVNCNAVLNMLDLIRMLTPQTKFFQGGSAEVFDRCLYPQNETTLIKPRNPYGVAKAAAQEMVRIYREHKGLFACTGIFFNMESPLRTTRFFSRKVVTEVVRIKRALDKGDKPSMMMLGKLHAIRDWGYSKEYMDAAYAMMQATVPDDYVIGTGVGHKCTDFIDCAFEAVGLSWPKYEHLYMFESSQPSEVNSDAIISNPRKILDNLRWCATTLMPDLVKLLVTTEMAKVPATAVT